MIVIWRIWWSQSGLDYGKWHCSLWVFWVIRQTEKARQVAPQQRYEAETREFFFLLHDEQEVVAWAGVHQPFDEVSTGGRYQLIIIRHFDNFLPGWFGDQRSSIYRRRRGEWTWSPENGTFLLPPDHLGCGSAPVNYHLHSGDHHQPLSEEWSTLRLSLFCKLHIVLVLITMNMNMFAF